MSSEDGLTGVWDGLFHYPRGYPPTSFTAVVLEIGRSISGTVHEVATAGPAAGQDVTAVIHGARDGAAVHFTKVYDGGGKHHRNPVHYDGTLSADGLEIEGVWRITGNWSGKFMMIRPGRPPAAAEERRDVLAPVD